MNIPLQSTSHVNSDCGNIADAWSMKNIEEIQREKAAVHVKAIRPMIYNGVSIQCTKERIHFPSLNTCNTYSHTCTDIEIGA
jgi:hypothetical protein